VRQYWIPREDWWVHEIHENVVHAREVALALAGKALPAISRRHVAFLWGFFVGSLDDGVESGLTAEAFGID
jgi:hypothetical protein